MESMMPRSREWRLHPMRIRAHMSSILWKPQPIMFVPGTLVNLFEDAGEALAPCRKTSSRCSP
jgi:hypothetical protein